MTAPLHRVLMNFQLREHWSVHFLEADCKTPLWPGRYYDFESVDRVRQILVRAAAPAETFEEFDRCVRSWSRGSVYLDLTEEQYGRLKRGYSGAHENSQRRAQGITGVGRGDLVTLTIEAAPKAAEQKDTVRASNKAADERTEKAWAAVDDRQALRAAVLTTLDEAGKKVAQLDTDDADRWHTSLREVFVALNIPSGMVLNEMNREAVRRNRERSYGRDIRDLISKRDGR